MTARSTFILLAMSLMLCASGPLGSMGFAQETIKLPFPTVGFQSGSVDEVHGSSIRIDGRTYTMKSDVIVVDHKGRELQLERIIPTSMAKFHLKEGHIDKMVVTLPQ
ncbi:MAG: hypothetical protein KF814_12575 [Nitrospiraceae bacterium]|nr:hypothetical protein [Nitrospiraceae bacterium]